MLLASDSPQCILSWRVRNTFLDFNSIQTIHDERHARANSVDSGLTSTCSEDWAKVPDITELFFEKKESKFTIQFKRSDQQAVEQQPERDQEPETTVMLRNIACRYSEFDVAAILDDSGFFDKYDFIYVPLSPGHETKKRQSNFGYAFVNFAQREFAEECRQAFNGRRFGRCSSKLCQVKPAKIQGDANCAPWGGCEGKPKKQPRGTPVVVKRDPVRLPGWAQQNAHGPAPRVRDPRPGQHEAHGQGRLGGAPTPSLSATPA